MELTLKGLRKDNIDIMIDAILEQTRKEILDFDENIKIQGKRIETANVEQASWQAYYDERKVRIKSLLDYYDMKTKEARGNSFKLISSSNSKGYTERSIERLIDTDPTYLKYYRIYLEVKELYTYLDSMSEQFRNRSFLLNNIVKIRIAGLEDISIYD